MAAENCREIERRIVTHIIEQALWHFSTVRVHDGEALLPVRDTVEKTLEDMFSVDEEWLYIYDEEGHRVGAFFFVYGNSGWDVMSDWSGKAIEHIGESGLELGNKICDEEFKACQ